MFSHNGKISARQVMILLILQMLNMNMLIMPRIGANYLGRNSYIAPIIAILIGLIYLFCVTSLTTKFPKSTFVEITKELLPNWISYILIVAFAAKLVISVGLELRMFGELVNQVMLPRTPISIIMIVFILSAAYLVKSGIESTGRMSEILIYFIAVPLIIALLIMIFKTDYREVLPFFQVDPTDVGIGTVLVSFMFVPLEILLMLNGLMEHPNRVRKSGIRAIIVVGVLQAIITLLCITQNGLQETQTQMWPVIVLMKSLGMNDTIVENQEVLLLIMWVFSIYMYISTSLYIISLIGSRSYKFKRENVFILPAVPIILFIALFPNDLGVVYSYYVRFEYYYGIWFIIPIPLILVLIAKMRRGRG